MTWAYTNDLGEGPEFFARCELVAVALKTEPLELLKVWMSESGVHSEAHNPHGHASGIFQAMPETLRGLGYRGSHEDFRKLSGSDQCKPWAERYYRPYKGFLHNATACYVATFLPALLSNAHDPEYVLCAKMGKLGWAYTANAVFDVNRDGRITVAELGMAIDRACRGPRWAELRLRMAKQLSETPEAQEYLGNALADAQRPERPQDWDLATIRGAQAALAYLGLAPGPIDGMLGPRTHGAIRSFQHQAGIDVDGIYGPITRKKLLEALLRAAA